MVKKCMKCGGTMKKGGPVKKIMAKGGSVGAGIPYRSGAGQTDGKNGMMKKGGAVKKMAKGGSLKSVPASKVGLAKLPTAVRNKMGYKKTGGPVKKKK